MCVCTWNVIPSLFSNLKSSPLSLALSLYECISGRIVDGGGVSVGQTVKCARRVDDTIHYMNEGDLAGIQFRKIRHCFWKIGLLLLQLECYFWIQFLASVLACSPLIPFGFLNYDDLL